MLAIIDNALFMGVYGHCTKFEAVPPPTRVAFYDSYIRLAEENVDKFYASWKRFRAANPFLTGDEKAQDSDTAKLLDVFYGSDSR